MVSDLETSGSEILMSVQELRDRLPAGSNGDLVVADARSPRRYLRGHLPGAVNLPLAALVTMHGPAQVVVGPEAFARQVGGAGIDAEVEVVVYGERGGMEAAYVFWALEYYGHPRVRFLNGGLEGWQAAGGSVSDEPVEPQPRTFSPRIRPELRADVDRITARMDDPEQQLVDTRTQAEFTGQLVAAARGGHIPGAQRLDWEISLDGDLQFKLRQELREQWQAAGILPQKDTVLYCLTGPRAAHVYVGMKSAGFGAVSLYDGSWSEWASREELPAVTD